MVEVKASSAGRRTLTVGEVAERAGVATSALRYYEANGLITSERNDVGQTSASRSTGKTTLPMLLTRANRKEMFSPTDEQLPLHSDR